MKHLSFTTDNNPPLPDDNSVWAKIYRKHDFGEIFESYLAWGPQRIEIRGHLSLFTRKFIVESMYWLNKPEDIRGEREEGTYDHLELLCKLFKLPLKAHKKSK